MLTLSLLFFCSLITAAVRLCSTVNTVRAFISNKMIRFNITARCESIITHRSCTLVHTHSHTHILLQHYFHFIQRSRLPSIISLWHLYKCLQSSAAVKSSPSHSYIFIQIYGEPETAEEIHSNAGNHLYQDAYHH